MTAPAGAHALMAGEGSPATTLLSYYDGWMREHQSSKRRSGSPGNHDVLLEKPCQTDDTLNESDGHRLLDARD
jgi:hypothetical protein